MSGLHLKHPGSLVYLPGELVLSDTSQDDPARVVGFRHCPGAAMGAVVVHLAIVVHVMVLSAPALSTDPRGLSQIFGGD